MGSPSQACPCLQPPHRPLPLRELCWAQPGSAPSPGPCVGCSAGLSELPHPTPSPPRMDQEHRLILYQGWVGWEGWL